MSLASASKARESSTNRNYGRTIWRVKRKVNSASSPGHSLLLCATSVFSVKQDRNFLFFEQDSPPHNQSR
jgi:hypothetical protein